MTAPWLPHLYGCRASDFSKKISARLKPRGTVMHVILNSSRSPLPLPFLSSHCIALYHIKKTLKLESNSQITKRLCPIIIPLLKKKHKAYFSVCLQKHLHWEKIRLETHSPEQDQAPRSHSNCVSPCKRYHCLTANNCFKLSRTFPTALSYRVTWQREPPERKNSLQAQENAI